AAFIYDKAISWNLSESLIYMVGISVNQFKMPVTIGFKPLSMTVFVQNILRYIIDGIFKHLGRCRVKGRVYTSPFTYDELYFRNVLNTFVQCPDELQVLFDTGMWHTGRHQQEGTFI